MAIRSTAVLVIISLGFAFDLHAQTPTPPGRWETIAALPAGSSLLIDLSSGQPIRGGLARIGPDSLTLTLPSGQERELTKAAIDRIRSGVPRRDGVGNGIAYGALAGAGTIGGFFIWAYSSCGAGCDAPAVHEIVPGAMAMGAGIGALAGFLIDKAHQRRDVLYRRGSSSADGPGSPVRFGAMLTRRSAAVQVALVK